MFSLTKTILYLAIGERLYATFVDYEKAFDSVD